MPSYRVTSKHRVLGHEPGAEFSEEIEPSMEARLLAGGHLELVSGAPAVEPDPEPESEE